MTFDITVRCSSLTEVPDCERRWAARHAADLIGAAGFTVRQVPGHIGAKVGTATHSGVAHMLQHKINTGELSSRADAEDAGIESLRTEMETGAVMDESTPSSNVAERQVQRMVQAYYANVAPMIKPLAVEQALEARFNPRITLTGHLDLAEEDHLETVRDLKTGVHQRPNHPQYGGYSLLRRSHHHRVTRFVEDYVPRGAIERPQKPPISTEYPLATCEQSARAVLTRLDTLLTAFAADGNPWHWIPNPSSMLCSAKFCPAHGTAFCQAHKAK